MPNQATASKPGSVSDSVGTSGSDGERMRLATASARSFPDFTCGSETPRLSHIMSTWPETRSASAGAVPLYGTCVISRAAGHRLEQLRGEVRGAAAALRGVVELAGIRSGERDQLGHRVRRHLRVHQQHVRNRGDHRDRHELRRVVGQARVQQPVDHQRRRRRGEQRVAVRIGLEHRVGADVAGGARAVLDDHRLAPLLRQASPRRCAASGRRCRRRGTAR